MDAEPGCRAARLYFLGFFFWCFVQLFCLKPMLLQRRGCDSLGLTAVLCQYGIQTGKNWHSSLQTLLSFPLPCRSEAGIHKEIKTKELQLQTEKILLHGSVPHGSPTAAGFYFWNFLSYLEIHLCIGGKLSLDRDKGQGEES
ncbi:hypothetical protein DV515_00017328 [Chloebia gouldiae]|uniref:Uncharacterized protein n=1 Tax=Chloebia gouldiae TaxID=44316 RepID=A0A3L8QWA6_CHLGU|nr:hypothetical protein DV515_00017327 [Chloebia gouldiae]RLV71559.1 hypothetical protein DV515_00017328 [Chloebia gouldiae]